MKKLIGIFFSLLTLFLLSGSLFAAADPDDKEGSKDPALFNRIPGFFISRYDDIEFDKYDFQTGSGKTQTVEGHRYFIQYYLKSGAQQPSPLQIIRNYINAVKAIGGKVVYQWQDPEADVTLKVVKNGAEVWVYVRAGSNGIYELTIIEKQAMVQDVTADANSLAQNIKETGKAARYTAFILIPARP